MLKSGEIEKQELFISRVSGYATLFASCLISPGVGGERNSGFSMEHGWMLLARIASIKPHPSTTATVLTSLLNVCGHRLTMVYGQQGFKLLKCLQTQFLPVINRVTSELSETDGGASERLDQCLNELLSGSRRDEPSGYLDNSFWYS